MADYSQSSSGDGTDPSEDDLHSDVPAPGPLNQDAISASASASSEELFLDNEAALSPDETASGTQVIMNSRAYQLEMFAESMRQNIIVAVSLSK